MCALSLLTVGTFGTACGSTSESVRPATDGPVTIRVPGDARTIQQAVSAARAGDLVLVAPGTYRESVHLGTPDVVLRGADRNRTIIDGEVRRANGVVVTAPGVVVENLTVRNHTLNGVLVTGMSDGTGGLARGSTGYTRLDPAAFPPLQGFRVSYVTSSNNALYGIYAFDSQRGVIEHSYASGSADSGIYVGQCKPCDILVADNVAERNAVGFEGANASGAMFVLRNRFAGNRVGLTSNSDYQEAFVPQEDATIVGNVIGGNAEPQSPAQADGGFGIGVGIAGGRRNLVARNLITGNPALGLALASSEDLPPVENRLIANVLRDNGIDVVYAASPRAPGHGNCLAGNELTSTLPGNAVEFMACPSQAGPVAGVALPRVAAPAGMPFREVPAGPDQPNRPQAGDGPPVPARDLPGRVDVDDVGLPPVTLLAERSGVGR
jgi:hypothetical protein